MITSLPIKGPHIPSAALRFTLPLLVSVLPLKPPSNILSDLMNHTPRVLDDHLSTWKGSFAPNSSFFSPHSSLPLMNTTKPPKPTDENWPPILLDEAHSFPKPILYCCWCCPASSTMTMTRRKTTLSHHTITSCPLINNTRVPYLALAATVNIASWVKKSHSTVSSLNKKNQRITFKILQFSLERSNERYMHY